MTYQFDFVIVGAGIVGLTIARELRQRYQNATIAIIEKENHIGAHASGRNSGVLHCGIYYGSETLKARLCADGAAAMIDFARAEGIAVEQSGKLIAVSDESQLPVIDDLLVNAKENNIKAELVDAKQINNIEPHAVSDFSGIYCPSTAVIDSAAVLEKLTAQLIALNVTFLFNRFVKQKRADNIIQTNKGDIGFGFLFNCAGAYTDKIAKTFDCGRDYALMPFKGIYWKLTKAAEHKVRANIYPVPDISMPFLGVHLTRNIKGEVYVGPTAIPAFGRENYGLVTGIDVFESLELLPQIISMYYHNQNNFRKLAHSEMKKYLKSVFLRAGQKLVPSLHADDLQASAKAGIRPQLVNIKTKKLEMDYILETADNSIHVLNAISPAFTCSLAFAKMIVDKAIK